MLNWLAVFLGLFAVTWAGSSPNADLVLELKNDSEYGPRFSSNIFEDALLDAPGLVTKYGYPIEVHDVITSDGYILQMHRLPHGRGVPTDPSKPPVFIMHGLLSSSADFLVLGPGNAVAYILADLGYDVWLGNARGNFYSRRHITLDPDDKEDTFWRFSWDEIGCHDLPAMIDHVIQVTGKEKIHYIGHSQGGTSFLVLTSMRPEYNEKFVSFQGLAPASFFVHNDYRPINAIAPYENILEALLFSVTSGELLGRLSRSQLLTYGVYGVCSDLSFLQPLCHSMPIVGGFIQSFNTTMLPLFIGHAPAGASIRQLAHYGQSINSGRFRRFDHGIIGNIARYGSITPPDYALNKITTPSYLHYTLGDILVHPDDIYLLANALGNQVGMYRVPREDFLHVDFMWGRDAKEMYIDTLVQTLRDAENNASGLMNKISF